MRFTFKLILTVCSIFIAYQSMQGLQAWLLPLPTCLLRPFWRPTSSLNQDPCVFTLLISAATSRRCQRLGRAVPEGPIAALPCPETCASLDAISRPTNLPVRTGANRFIVRLHAALVTRPAVAQPQSWDRRNLFREFQVPFVLRATRVGLDNRHFHRHFLDYIFTGRPPLPQPAASSWTFLQ